MKYTYRVRTDTIADDDDNSVVVYGIDVTNEKGIVTNSVPNMFLKKHNAQKLVALCNELKLSPVHLMDVIEDALI